MTSSGSNSKKVFHTISTPAFYDVQKRREESLIKGLKKKLIKNHLLVVSCEVIEIEDVIIVIIGVAMI